MYIPFYFLILPQESDLHTCRIFALNDTNALLTLESLQVSFFRVLMIRWINTIKSLVCANNITSGPFHFYIVLIIYRETYVTPKYVLRVHIYGFVCLQKRGYRTSWKFSNGNKGEIINRNLKMLKCYLLIIRLELSATDVPAVHMNQLTVFFK